MTEREPDGPLTPAAGRFTRRRHKTAIFLSRSRQMPLQALQQLERTIEKRIRLFEQKNGIRLDDEVRFIRSWIERPLTMGAISPSGKVLARTMASYVDPSIPGPVIELGPGTGPVTEALVVELDPATAVLCTHGDVLGLLLGEEPEKGSTWLVERGHDGRLIRGAYLPPPA